MAQVIKLTFNPFMENTYIVYDGTKDCIIIDPGCATEREKAELVKTIDDFGLRPVRLINTHCHIDHIPGNPFVAKKYELALEIHQNEVGVLAAAPAYGEMFGMVIEEQPPVNTFINEGDDIQFGDTTLKVLFTPGHSPGSISMYSEAYGFILSGDVLFYESVGRYDLPGADGKVLYQSINQKLMLLPDAVVVYSGHGPETTIGHERVYNPFMGKKSKLNG